MDLESVKPRFESWLQALTSCENLNKLFNFSECQVLSYTCDIMKQHKTENVGKAWSINMCPIQDQFSSGQFSHSVKSDSLWPHGLQHSRLPCPSPTPGACSNSCPNSCHQWGHPTISSSVVPFSSNTR